MNSEHRTEKSQAVTGISMEGSLVADKTVTVNPVAWW